MKGLLLTLAGAVLLAASVPAPAAAQAAKDTAAKSAPAGKMMSASGTVTAVNGNSLAIKGSKGEMNFTVDEKTKVTAAGGSTKTREAKEAGTKTTITDFVNVGDTVSVNYHDMSGTMHASAVRVSRKAPKK